MWGSCEAFTDLTLEYCCDKQVKQKQEDMKNLKLGASVTMKMFIK